MADVPDGDSCLCSDSDRDGTGSRSLPAFRPGVLTEGSTHMRSVQAVSAPEKHTQAHGTCADGLEGFTDSLKSSRGLRFRKPQLLVPGTVMKPWWLVELPAPLHTRDATS